MEAVPYKRPKHAAGISAIAALCLSLCIVPAVAQSRSHSVGTIFVIPGSHWDLGFLRPPLQEMDAIKPHLDAVMDACEADPKFRWTIESGWQLQAWLDRTKDTAQIRRLAGLMRKGEIELSAADGSMHTEFMGTEELSRLASGRTQAERRFGIHSDVAMMNDVPGFSLRLPQVLARSGVKYLITGSNTGLGGGMDLAPGKMPIYWESPDGSRILMWQTQGKNGGYTEGMTDYYLDPDAEDPYLHTKFYPKEWAGLPKLEIMRRGVDKLLKQYSDAGYRHSALAVLYMHDGIGPEFELKGLLPSVRAWNAAGNLPRIVIATPSEFFRYMAAHDADGIPVYRGDWTGLWSQVKLNSPAISADARALQDQLPEAETLWSLLTLSGLASSYPGNELASDYKSLFVYDEHNGAGQGGWPKVMTQAEVLEQNRQYADSMRRATRSAKELLNSGVASLAPPSRSASGERVLLVYNPLSWTSSQLVRVPDLQGEWVVRDAASRAVLPSQHLLSGDLCFDAQQVPSVGYRSYLLEAAPRPNTTSASLNSSSLVSPYFQVDLNPDTGTIARITDLRLPRTLVDEKNGNRAGDLMHGSSAFGSSSSAERPTIHHERGALVDQAVIERTGSPWAKTVIALPQNESQVNLTEVLDRSKLPFIENGQHSDPYSFAFAFSLQGDVQRWIEDGEGLYRFPQALLPGARSDAAVPRHTLVWSDNTSNSSYHVMLAQQQAFFDRFPAAFTSGTSQGIQAEVMIKSDQGDTRDLGVVSFDTFEPGYPSTYAFSFALTAAPGAADSVEAHRFGMQHAFEVVQLLPGHRPAEWARSFLSLSTPNVIVLAMKPSSDGNPDHFMLRLQEVAGKSSPVRLNFAFPILTIAETTLTEDRILRSKLAKEALRLSPYQTLTLRIAVPQHVEHVPEEKP